MKWTGFITNQETKRLTIGSADYAEYIQHNQHSINRLIYIDGRRNEIEREKERKKRKKTKASENCTNKWRGRWMGTEKKLNTQV